MRRLLTAMVATGLQLGSGLAVVQASTPAARSSEVHISSGRLFLDGEQVAENLSLVQSRFGFLFFYLPGFGLVTVSDHPFPDAVVAGRFDGPVLEVELGGRTLRLDSAVDILGSEGVAAWAQLDPGFTLDTDSATFGYGDDRDAPKDWRKYVHRDG